MGEMSISKALESGWNEVGIMSFDEFIKSYQTGKAADWILVIAIFQDSYIYGKFKSDILRSGYNLIVFDHDSLIQDISSFSKANGQLLFLSGSFFNKKYASNILKLSLQFPRGCALNLSVKQSKTISKIFEKIKVEIPSSYLFKKELITLYLADLFYQFHKILISTKGKSSILKPIYD